MENLIAFKYSARYIIRNDLHVKPTYIKLHAI